MSRRSLTLAAVAASSLLLAACGSSGGGGSSTAAPTTSAAPTSSAAPNECAPENLPTLTKGVLTVGTDSPAYPPYFIDDDPSNGKGFESAVTYSIAAELGFTPEQVQWVVVPFNKSYAPGPKDFDFDINQISITPKRAEKVTFSQGYYTVNQAVIALADSPIANATSLAQLKTAKLGAQVGTTSLAYITDFIQPEQEPFVYNDTNDAKSALKNGQIDGIVVDLPTAFYITAVEIPKGKIVGQFPPVEGGEQFGLVFAKDNPLVGCVDKAITALTESGELKALTDEWMTGPAAPFFTE